jgi:hypothetical protein
MIYTSYFNNIPNLIKLGYSNFISIAGNTPEWFEEKIHTDNRFRKFSYLAPKYIWWKDWKSGKLNNLDYEKLYKETVLDKIDFLQLKQELNINPVLLCYELPNDFCHRHLLAKWIKVQSYNILGQVESVAEVLI